MWNGTTRRDGVHVTPLDTANKWVIAGPDGSILYDHCPCCTLTIPNERAAKLIADGWIPMPPEAA